MKKINKIVIIAIVFVLCIISIFMMIKYENKSENENKNNYTISVIIEDNKNQELYNQKVETNKTKLVDVLEELNVDLKVEDGDYGAYITSLMGIDQISDDNGMYYWSYYINDEYANEGISSCEIKNNETYKFVYEYFAN